jgi:hypothetical protein
MGEAWLPCHYRADRYEVSSLGRVRSSWGCGRILKQRLDTKGYPRLGLGRHCRNFNTHTLILYAFHGPPPSPRHQANHRDGDKENNSEENLEWVTASQNIQHGFDTGLMTPLRGTSNGRCRLSVGQVMEIRGIYDGGNLSHRALGELYGMSTAQIGKIVARKQWTHV